MRSRIKIAAAFLTIFLIAGCERGDDAVSSDDGLPPSTPANFSLDYARDGEVLIYWDENNDFNLKGYEIFRSLGDTNNFNMIDIVAPETYYHDNYYVDDSLSYDQNYFYKIRAVKYNGMASGFTNIITAKPENRNPPAINRNLYVYGRNWEGKKEVYLSWKNSSSSDVAGYNVYRSAQPEFTPNSSNKIGFATQNFYADTAALSELTQYYYVYQSVDKGGLTSKEFSYTASDLIHSSPEVITPVNGATLRDFVFKFKGLKVPAIYEVVVQTNPYYGEVWRGQASDSGSNDEVTINFEYKGLYSGRFYYWRVITYSNGESPNSISKIYNFWVSP
ncbi:MAG TPA: hypothetical protein VHO28_05810 [Ignavibacteriales bacterium]|nr:hypothetical protein [Ignavibacteriales bacterium]